MQSKLNVRWCATLTSQTMLDRRIQHISNIVFIFSNNRLESKSKLVMSFTAANDRRIPRSIRCSSALRWRPLQATKHRRAMNKRNLCEIIENLFLFLPLEKLVIVQTPSQSHIFCFFFKKKLLKIHKTKQTRTKSNLIFGGLRNARRGWYCRPWCCDVFTTDCNKNEWMNDIWSKILLLFTNRNSVSAVRSTCSTIFTGTHYKYETKNKKININDLFGGLWYFTCPSR